MRKIKLLSALLAIVMVLPLLVGLGAKATAGGPVMQALVYLNTPQDRNTFESMKLPQVTTYADNATLTEATTDQLKMLNDKNIEYVTIGRADFSAVGGWNLVLDPSGSKQLTMANVENELYKELAKFDYQNFPEPYYVVRMVGPMKKAWIDKLTSLGGKLQEYPVAPDTYIVRIPRKDEAQFRQLDFIKGICLFSPALKSSAFPKNSKGNTAVQSVVITVAGGLTDDEVKQTSLLLKGFGCKTFLQAKIERFFEEKPPAKPEDLPDEEYVKLVQLWEDERKPFIDMLDAPLSEKEPKTKLRDVANTITVGYVGGVEGLNKDPFKSDMEYGFIRCLLPVTKMVDLAKIPWVINIDSFSAPEGQNDLSNYNIGSHWAWAADESSGVVNSPADPLPHGWLDHFGLHGESLQPTTSLLGIGGNAAHQHYRQIVAICGTGLDTGDVTDVGYYMTDEFNVNPTNIGDFGGRIVDHRAYVRITGGRGNYTDGRAPNWRYPPPNGTATRSPRGYWANINRWLGGSFYTGVWGSSSQPWMDWDGHDTHVAGSGFGDGYWSRGSTPPDTDAGRNPYSPGPAYDPASAVAPGSQPANLLPCLPAPFGNTANAGPWDYRGVAYRAGIVVQRVVENNFIGAYNYFRTSWPWVWNPYRLYWVYAGRPRYLGLYNDLLPEAGYLRAFDAFFTILNDAYNMGARVHVDAWVVPHRGTWQGGTPPNSVGDREITYDGNIYNSNEYNFFSSQGDRYCWERKDMTIVQAGTTNTRFAAPFIYDFEPIDWDNTRMQIPFGAQWWYDGPQYYSSPWCFTTPNAAQFYVPGLIYPVLPIPQKGVYYPPIGDTSTNLPVEFSYYYQNITQPPTTLLDWPTGHADGKTDYGTLCLSPATAKNPITVGASESYRSILRWAPNTPAMQPPNRPWVYNLMYGGWFPLAPLSNDNTGNSDAPVGVTHSAGAGSNPWYNDATNAWGQVAAFSGRGPTPDLDYSHGNPDPNTWEPAGRYKPDIVAPGTQIMSTASFLTNRDAAAPQQPLSNPIAYSGNSYDGVRQVVDGNIQLGGPYLLRHPSTANPTGRTDPVNNLGHTLMRHYAIMEGTSCATGFVAGAAAITRQYFQNRGLTLYPHPQSSLIKATLIHGAHNLGGQQDYDINQPPYNYNDWLMLSAKPNYDQGFGRLDIRKSLFPPDPYVNLYEDHIAGITTGERHTFYYEVLDDTVPFEATMAYIDMPKLPNPQVALDNDLDLIVTDPGGTEYHGNVYTTDPHIDEHTNLYEYWGRISMANPGGTRFDRRNNVERVVIPPVQIKRGTWTVTVSGARVEQSSTNIPQTYSFVVSGGNLRAAVTPPPEVPALSPIGLLLVILGIIGIGAFFMLRKRASA